MGTAETWEITVGLPASTLGGRVALITCDEVTGREEELFDLEVQLLGKRGFRVVDKAMVVDPSASPPVSGWILFRETTNAERNNVRPITLFEQCQW